eukprot:Nk52_evm2s1730 gene=Nk52_evmTU2s1730
MVYNSKLSGALLVLAFLACLFMVSSAKSIHEQPLHEGGLKFSPNDALKKGIRLQEIIGDGPYCAYKFLGANGKACLIPTSMPNSKLKTITCFVQGPSAPSCPKVLNNEVDVVFSETSQGKYELELQKVSIDHLPKDFNSEVYREKRGSQYRTLVKDKFNKRYRVAVFVEV